MVKLATSLGLAFVAVAGCLAADTAPADTAASDTAAEADGELETNTHVEDKFWAIDCDRPDPQVLSKMVRIPGGRVIKPNVLKLDDKSKEQKMATRRIGKTLAPRYQLPPTLLTVPCNSRVLPDRGDCRVELPVRRLRESHELHFRGCLRCFVPECVASGAVEIDNFCSHPCVATGRKGQLGVCPEAVHYRGAAGNAGQPESQALSGEFCNRPTLCHAA
jgi:hypothetical protein